jgi:hypothetical protein
MTTFQILGMQLFDLRQMDFKRATKLVGQHRYPSENAGGVCRALSATQHGLHLTRFARVQVRPAVGRPKSVAFVFMTINCASINSSGYCHSSLSCTIIVLG